MDFGEPTKHLITENEKTYALPTYNFDSIENISNSDMKFVINDQLFSEFLLMEISQIHILCLRKTYSQGSKTFKILT